MPSSSSGTEVDFLKPVGEPSLVPPGSPQWRVFKNPVSFAIGGVAAVLLEFADPRIRSGVWDHSIYKVDPVGRSRRTGMAAMAGVFAAASTARAVIGGVNRMHRKVTGKTPKGEGYRALDSDLLDWVSATASYSFLEAYHRFVSPLSEAERNQYYRDSQAVARLYGVANPLGTDADFFAMLDRRLPGFEAHEINFEFLSIIMSGRAAPAIPELLHRALARAAVSLLPPSVRERLEIGSAFDMAWHDRVVIRAAARLADRTRSRQSPAWQAAVRMGLPNGFAWWDAARQQRHLARHPILKESRPAT